MRRQAFVTSAIENTCVTINSLDRAERYHCSHFLELSLPLKRRLASLVTLFVFAAEVVLDLDGAFACVPERWALVDGLFEGELAKGC